MQYHTKTCVKRNITLVILNSVLVGFSILRTHNVFLQYNMYKWNRQKPKQNFFEKVSECEIIILYYSFHNGYNFLTASLLNKVQ